MKNDFFEKFEHLEEIKKSQIIRYLKQKEPSVKSTTINYRILKMVEEGVLQRTGHGKYNLGKAVLFKPSVTKQMRQIYKRLSEKFPFIDYCIWDTRVLNSFMVHQPLRFYLLVEVDREATESVFYSLSEFEKNVYLNPDEKTIELYVSKNINSIIVKTLVTESPVQMIEKNPTIMLEKLLVDIYCDEYLFAAQQGGELSNIYREAFERFTINKSSLLRYASRRKRKKEIENYIKENA